MHVAKPRVSAILGNRGLLSYANGFLEGTLRMGGTKGKEAPKKENNNNNNGEEGLIGC